MSSSDPSQDPGSGSAGNLCAFKDSLPILMGYGTMGFAAGIVFAASSGAGLPALWSGLAAVTSFSGTLQFAIGQWFRDERSLVFVAIATFAMSFRYAFYGLSLVGKWRGVGFFRKLFLVFSLTDENYAIMSGRQSAPTHLFVPYCVRLCALNLLYWTSGCTLGAIFGSAFSIPGKGIEFVMAALFISILVDQVRSLCRS